jgi:hypothetical protein
MHIVLCIEDASGEKFLNIMVPKLIEGRDDITFKAHGYKGIGRLPSNLGQTVDPRKRTLLDNLPRLLRGFAKTPGIDAVVFVVDTDDRDCVGFLAELMAVAEHVVPSPTTLFRLAIEEMEAWYFGDPNAIQSAYPTAKTALIQGYQSDSVCGTWERLADVIVPGGAAKLKDDGWPASGIAKSEWAERITPFMNPDENSSPSFRKFRDGVRALTQN